MEPAQSPLHHPPVHPEAATMGFTSLSQHRHDVQPTQCLPQWTRVVGSVTEKLLGPLSWSTPLAFQWRYRLYKRHGLGHIMYVGSGQTHSQRHALGVGHYMVFTAGLSPICGIGSREVPPKLPLRKRCPPLLGSNPAGWQPASVPDSANVSAPRPRLPATAASPSPPI